MYQYNGCETSDPIPESLQRKFWRGAALGDAYQRDYIEQYPDAEMEKSVDWPTRTERIGTGHADLVREFHDKVIEVKSGKASGPTQWACLQVTGYARFLGLSRAEIHVIEPVSGIVGIFPINTDTYMNEVQRIITTLQESIRLNTLPHRVCDSPGAWQAQGCQFRTKCFQGWLGDPIAPDEDEIWDLDDAHDFIRTKLQDMDSLRGQIAEHEAAIKELDKTRKHIRSEIRQYMPTGQWVRFGEGGRSVRIGIVKQPATIRVDTLTESGWTVPPQWQPLVKPESSYERWTFR
jgi:hypothetical protein